MIIPCYSEFILNTKCRLNWIVCSVVFQITVRDYVGQVQGPLWYLWPWEAPGTLKERKTGHSVLN